MSVVYAVGPVRDLSSGVRGALLRDGVAYGDDDWYIVLHTYQPLSVGEDFIHEKLVTGLPYEYTIKAILIRTREGGSASVRTVREGSHCVVIAEPRSLAKPKHRKEIKQYAKDRAKRHVPL